MKEEIEILKTVLRGSIDRKVNNLTPADFSMIRNVISLIENTKHIHTKEDVIEAYKRGALIGSNYTEDIFEKEAEGYYNHKFKIK